MVQSWGWVACGARCAVHAKDVKKSLLAAGSQSGQMSREAGLVWVMRGKMLLSAQLLTTVAMPFRVISTTVINGTMLFHGTHTGKMLLGFHALAAFSLSMIAGTVDK